MKTHKKYAHCIHKRACMCAYVTWGMAESDSEVAANSFLSSTPRWSVQCCPVRVVCICEGTCAHVPTSPSRKTVLVCALLCSLHSWVRFHTECVCVPVATGNLSISDSASWWVVDAWFSFELPCSHRKPGPETRLWGTPGAKLSWDWTDRPLGVTVALLAIVERGLFCRDTGFQKKEVFLLKFEVPSVWDVCLHFEIPF